MKKKLGNLIKSIIFILLTGIVIFSAAGILKRKGDAQRFADFFEQEEDFDVLFFGTSHVTYDVFPMELWKDYGIVSYNCGTNGVILPSNYWILKMALEYKEPKVVVIDLLSLDCPDTKILNMGHLQAAMDLFPLSPLKIRAVQDIFDDRESEFYPSRWDILFPINKYHSRWKELTREDFGVTPSVEKGAGYLMGVTLPEGDAPIPAGQKSDTDTMAVEYLHKMVEECQSRGIAVLLVYLPFPSLEGQQMDANAAYDLAEEWGVNYINFLQIDGVVNYNTDCYDPKSHLNVSGARKVTDYLGACLRDSYQIPDHRGEEQYSYWNDDYADYVNFKISGLKMQWPLKEYLVLLADRHWESTIYLPEDFSPLQDPIVQELIGNIDRRHITGSLENENVLFDAAFPSALQIAVTDAESGELIDTACFVPDGLTAVRQDASILAVSP